MLCRNAVAGEKGFIFFLSFVVISAFFFKMQPVQGAEFTISPLVYLETRYNDNIYFTQKDQIDDVYLVFSPAVKLRQRNERGEINVTGKFDSFSYLENTELNSIDPEISAEGNYALSPVFSVNGSGLYRIDYQQDRDITSTGLVSSSSKREQNQGSLGLGWVLSEKTSLGTQVGLGRTVYEDPGYSDNTSQSFNLQITSDISRLVSETTSVMYLSHSRYDYDLSTANYSSASVGFEKNLTEKYSFSARVGPSFVQTEYSSASLEKTEEWGAGAHFSLDGKFEKSTMNLSLTQSMEPDNYNRTSVYRTAMNARYFRKISADLSLGLNAGYFRNESTGDTNGSRNDSNENTFTISPRILYQITDDLGLEANYRFSRIEDDNDDSERMQNSFFIRLIWRHSISESDFSFLL